MSIKDELRAWAKEHLNRNSIFAIADRIDWEHESDCEDRAALLREYASKLRLVEGEDA